MQNQPIFTMYFNHGAFVTWQEADCDEAVTRHGIVECERTDKKGWFYVRNEHGDLEQLHWTELTLANRKNM